MQDIERAKTVLKDDPVFRLSVIAAILQGNRKPEEAEMSIGDALDKAVEIAVAADTKINPPPKPHVMHPLEALSSTGMVDR